MPFTKLSEATLEDLQANFDSIDEDAKHLPDRLLDMLKKLDNDRVAGVAVNRYEHSMQSASHAARDGRDKEYVVAALLHDIGDELAPYNHGEFTAAIFRPYMSERMCWIVEVHPIFQNFHIGNKLGIDRNGRDKYRNHPWYRDAVEFCAKYDQACFDPAYESLPLEYFEPMVREVFAEPRSTEERFAYEIKKEE